jgi:hypothetical protein
MHEDRDGFRDAYSAESGKGERPAPSQPTRRMRHLLYVDRDFFDSDEEWEAWAAEHEGMYSGPRPGARFDPQPPAPVRPCTDETLHWGHRWSTDDGEFHCLGRARKVCDGQELHDGHAWANNEHAYLCPGLTSERRQCGHAPGHMEHYWCERAGDGSRWFCDGCVPMTLERSQGMA